MATTKLPRRINLGGIFLLNPPEPRCHPTNVHDTPVLSVLDNPPDDHGKIVLPPAVRLDVAGPGRAGVSQEDSLTGSQRLMLSIIDPLTVKRSGNYRFTALYTTKGLNTGSAPFWSLLYGTFVVTSGPNWIDDGDPNTNPTYGPGWFLVSMMEDSIDGGYGPLQIYRFNRPLAEGDPLERSEDESAQILTFDPLGSNLFRVAPWIDLVLDPDISSEQDTAVGGLAENITLTVSAIWP